VIDGTVYAGSSDGGLYALSASDGRRIFRFDAKSPIFSGVARDGADRLVFGCMDGSVITLDRRTALEISRVRAGGGVVTTPVLAGGNLIVGSRDYMLYAFRASDGALAWKFSYWFSWVESTPAFADGTLYVGASDYRRVTAFDPASGAVRWATDVRGLAWGTPLVTVGTVFIGTVAQNIPGTAIVHTGGIMALDRRTGAVKWRHLAAPAAVNAFGGYAGSLALAGDFVIAAGFDGTLIALPAR
jgi:outer membrane protein assembly factor BamB